MKKILAAPLGLLTVLVLAGAEGGCQQKASSTIIEQRQQNLQMEQFLRNQPVPTITWSLERHMLIKIYEARQKATTTFSVVQSEFTGKVLWSCPSIGFPLPYATQLTNPLQAVNYGSSIGVAVVSQQEPNGTFSPPQADASWVPCVDEKGRITPVYEERKVTVFVRPVEEKDGRLVPSGTATLSIEVKP